MRDKLGDPIRSDRRARLESLLLEFDKAWTPASFSSVLSQIPRDDQKWWQLAVVQLVRVDLEHWWRADRERTVEDYLDQLPELGSDPNLVAELIHAEYEIRRQCGKPVALAALGRRFPKLLPQVKRLIEASGDSSVVAAQASIDTSQPGIQETAAGQPDSANSLPERFGRYRIVRQLGAGAMGAVYLAHDTQLDRQVALKTPSFGSDPDPELIKRFDREARSAATLRHPNICPVHDVGEIDGIHFITMAYIDGRPLSSYIRPNKAVPERTAAALVRKLASALSHAHQHGVIHRDLKPANIMVDRGHEPVVMDFGLARRADPSGGSRMTQSGMILGTPAYMSPEQAEGDPEKIGASSDQYSLGVMLYELLTTKLPFRGSIAAVIGQIMTQEPVWPRELRSDVDSVLELICLKMMSKNPDERFASMDDVAAALKGYLKGETENIRAATAESGLPANRASDSSHESGRVTETGGLDAFFADPLSQQAAETSVGVRVADNPVGSVQRRIATSRGRNRHRAKWIAIGPVAVVLILAGVIIYFSDGSRVEIEDGTHARVESNPNGTLKSVTTLPVESPPVESAPVESPPVESPPVESAIQPETDSGDLLPQTRGDIANVRPVDVFDSIDWQWSEPVFIGEFDTASNINTELTDEFQTWVAVTKEDSYVDPSSPHDIIMLTRQPDDAAWSPPVNLGEPINSHHDERGPCLSADGRWLVFQSNRPGGQGGRDDLWISERQPHNESWSKPINLGRRVNSNRWEGQSCISSDSLMIFFSSDRKKGHGLADLYMTQRSAVDQPWSAAVNLGAPVNSSASEMHPIISSDGLVLLFNDNGRPGGHGAFDIWVSRRASVQDSWSTPVNLGPPVNSAGHEFPSALSRDGRLLVFRRIPPGGKETKGHGFWSVRRVPK